MHTSLIIHLMMPCLSPDRLRQSQLQAPSSRLSTCPSIAIHLARSLACCRPFSPGDRAIINMADANMVPKQYSFQLLQEITDDFSEERKLGFDGQGIIYQGVQKDGKKIAVKLLHAPTTQGSDDNQLEEVDRTLAMFPHQNILRLVGHCHEAQGNYLPNDGTVIILEEKKRALCFEYTHNRSLREYLSDKSNENDWPTRYKIIRGICNGLEHLHQGVHVPICHLDLKPANILLDDIMVPRIADFSLSMIMKEEQAQNTSRRRNAEHHLPPEYIKSGVISTKFDIFSLGVLIIQIMTGPEGYFRNTESSAEQFIELVHVIWRERLQATYDLYSEQVKKCIEIAVSCMTGDHSKRPGIGAIVKELNLNVTTVLLPDSLGNNSGLSVNQENKSLHHESVVPTSPAYPLLLEEMMKGFSSVQRLGSGPHGEVYMGRLNDGKQIAVKILDNKAGFHNERFVEYLELAQRKHKNVMQLVECYQTTRREQEMRGGKIVHADVTRRALCFEYLQSLDNFLSESNGYDWAERYLIIKGICEGLQYLHDELEQPHMDLKPTNVLLDDKRVPKLADVGLSRLFDKGKIKIGNTSDVTIGYKQPEYTDVNAEKKADIHRLGVLIIEIISSPTKITGITHEDLTKHVYEDWRKKLQQTSTNAELCASQAKMCMEIALSCVDENTDQKPNISNIIKQLNVLDYLSHAVSMFPIAMTDESSSSCLSSEVELLDVYPPQLRFPFEPNKLIYCPLRLTNRTDSHHVAFRCIPKHTRSYLHSSMFLWQAERYASKLSEFRGILPPRSSFTYVLSVQMQQEHPANMDALAIIIESCTGRKGMRDQDVNDSFFQGVKKKQNGSDVHSVTLMAVCDPMAADSTTSLHQPAQPRIKIIYRREETLGQVTSIDLHPTEPWILAGHRSGYISIWNYETQESPRTLRIGEPSKFRSYIDIWIRSTKFIADKNWFLVADLDGYIHVRTIMEMDEVKMFKAHHHSLRSLDVNPIYSYVLSAGDDLIKLWDWENDWVCIREFKVDHNAYVHQIRFNRQDWKTFASVSGATALKIWDNSSSNHRVAFNYKDTPICVDYIVSGGDWQHVLVGYSQGTALIVDLKTRMAFPFLEGLQKCFLRDRSNVAVVNRLQPDDPTLVAALSDSSVLLSNSSTYRDVEAVQFNLGKVRDFASTERAKSPIAIAFDDGIAIMEV